MTELTLVMRRSAAPQGPGLRLALTSPAVAGSVRLQATATIEPPGQAVAVWSVDGARVGVSQWTGSGREWRTEITASLAAGQRLVTVAYGVMTASDTLTVQDAGSEPAAPFLTWVLGADPGPLGPGGDEYDAEDWPSGNGWGGGVASALELIEAADDDEGYVMAQVVNTDPVANWQVSLPGGSVTGTLFLRPAGPCLILRRVGTAAPGDYEITAEVVSDTYGPIILRIT